MRLGEPFGHRGGELAVLGGTHAEQVAVGSSSGSPVRGVRCRVCSTSVHIIRKPAHESTSAVTAAMLSRSADWPGNDTRTAPVATKSKPTATLTRALRPRRLTEVREAAMKRSLGA